MRWNRDKSLRLSAAALRTVGGSRIRGDSRLILSPKQHSSPSPATATTVEGDAPRDRWRAGDLSTPPRPIFPWRHDPNPLPRLVGEHAKRGGILGPDHPILSPTETTVISVICSQFCGYLLNIPWYERLLTSGWKQELAEASGWAFAQAVAGVLSNTYRVPFAGIMKNADTEKDADLQNSVNFEHTTSARKLEDANAPFPQADNMMEEKLINLYEAAHDSGKEQMLIQLLTRPVSSRLVSLYPIPCLTRKTVKENPALQRTYHNMLSQLQEKEEELGRVLSHVEISQFVSYRMMDLARERFELHPDGYGLLEHTIVAQVLVHCDEVFGVKDLLTDKMVQGDGLRRIVPHLIRLEMDGQSRFERSRSSATHHLGSWIITDWDDLLGGNVWLG